MFEAHPTPDAAAARERRLPPKPLHRQTKRTRGKETTKTFLSRLTCRQFFFFFEEEHTRTRLASFALVIPVLVPRFNRSLNASAEADERHPCIKEKRRGVIHEGCEKSRDGSDRQSEAWMLLQEQMFSANSSLPLSAGLMCPHELRVRL